MAVQASSIPLYSQIARENWQQLPSLEAAAVELESRVDRTESGEENLPLEIELMSLSERIAKHAAITIVFSAIAVEAYIYDYAARHFTDAYVRDYVDKLDPLAKWVVIPRLVTGRELPRNRRWFELLRNLIKTRNSIMHSKSSEPPRSAEEARIYLNRLQSEEEQISGRAKQAIELLGLLPAEMNMIDPAEKEWAEGYLSEYKNPMEEK